MSMAPSARSVPITASTLVLTGAGTYRGCSLRETAALAAVVNVYDGTSNAGTKIASYGWTAGGNPNVIDNCQIACAVGIFVEVVSGTVSGAIRFRNE